MSAGIDRRGFVGLSLAAAAVPAYAGNISPSGTSLPVWPPPETFPLWPGDPPGTTARRPRPVVTVQGEGAHRELQLRGVGTPTLSVVRPARPNGVGLLVIPGGGYEFLAVSNEGLTVANRFAAMGYTVFILAYRLPAEGWSNPADVPLQDAQRAMRLVRARAATYRIDPERISVIGFSAGGHVAASLVTGYDDRLAKPLDAVDRYSARPVAGALMYAVTTMRFPETHRGSREHLLGVKPSTAAVDRRSPVMHVSRDMPATFLLHALDDDIVSPDCSAEWLAAARQAKASVEAHFVQRGGHGFGVGLPAGFTGAAWPSLFDTWLERLTR